MAAASPGASVKVASDTTVSGPLGVGYRLVTLATSSMVACHAAINLEQAVRGPLDGILGAYLGECALGQRVELGPIGPQLEQHVGEAVRVVRFDQHASTGPLHHFGEGATARLHDGNAARHGLQQEHSLRLAVGRRHRQQVEAAEEVDLLAAVERAAVSEFLAEATGGERRLDLVEIWLEGGRQVARRL